MADLAGFPMTITVHSMRTLRECAPGSAAREVYLGTWERLLARGFVFRDRRDGAPCVDVCTPKDATEREKEVAMELAEMWSDDLEHEGYDRLAALEVGTEKEVG